MSHRRVDGRGRYGKEYGNSLVGRRTDEEEGLQARVRDKISLIPNPSIRLSILIRIRLD